MKNTEEDDALAILFANTNRKKRHVDLLTIAKACDFLVKLYGSKEELAKKIDLSPSMVRQLLTPLKLPENIQLLVQNRDIDSIEMISQIATIKDPFTQLSFVKELENLTSNDSRDIKRISKTLSYSIKEAKETILAQKPKKIHFFVIDLEDDTYNQLMKKSHDSGIKPAELVKKFVSHGLNQKEDIK